MNRETEPTTTSIADGVMLQTVGKVCVLFVGKNCSLPTSYASVNLGTVPSAYRPISPARGTAVVQDTSGKSVEIAISVAGDVGVYATGGDPLGTHYIHGCVPWICA